MAISVVTGGTQFAATNNGGDVSLAFPTLQQNDVVFVFGGHFPRTGARAVPSGYTTVFDSGAAGSSPHFGVSRKTMGATPDTGVTCPGSGNAADATAYACIILRGVDTTSIPDATATTAGPTTSTNPDAPSITTVTNGAMVLALALSMVSDASITVPSGYGNLVTANATDTNAAATVGGATLLKATAGAEDPPAFTTWSSGAWRSATLAIKPSGLVSKSGTDSLTPKTTEAVNTLVGASSRTDSLAPMLGDVLNTLAEGWDIQVRGVNGAGDGNWSNTATVWLPYGAAIAGPVLAWITDGTDNTPEIDLTEANAGDLAEGDTVVFQLDTVNTFDGADFVETTNTVDAGEDAAGALAFVSGSLADGTWYARARIDGPGAIPGAWSNIVSQSIDATAPTITSSSTFTANENQTAVGTVAADETCTFAITGGADASFFSINSSTGVLTFNSAPDYETPADGDADNDYELQVTATDTAGNASTPQSITVTVADVSEGGGTSYVTGDRTGSITVTGSAGLLGATGAKLVDGSFLASGVGSTFFNNALDVTGRTLTFDFGTAKIVDEAKWYQDTADSHGTWKWQGSNDNSSYTDVGSSFTLGGATTQTQTSLNGNTTAYRYWQLIGVSGTTTDNPWLEEIEFKQG